MDAQLAHIRHEARQAFDRRDYRKALDLYLSILDRYPKFADVRHFAGLCQSFLGDPQAALEQFDEALASNPAYVEAHINRALTLNELGRFAEARESFDRAAHYEQGLAGDFPAAVTARLANGHASLGDLYFEAGSPHYAAEQFRRALELRPRFHDIRTKLAMALLQLGDAEQAVQELQAVLESNHRFLDARVNLGLAWYRMGRIAEAKQEWEIAGVQEPENPQVRAYLAMLHRTEEAREVEA